MPNNEYWLSCATEGSVDGCNSFWLPYATKSAVDGCNNFYIAKRLSQLLDIPLSTALDVIACVHFSEREANLHYPEAPAVYIGPAGWTEDYGFWLPLGGLCSRSRITQAIEAMTYLFPQHTVGDGGMMANLRVAMAHYCPTTVAMADLSDASERHRGGRVAFVNIDHLKDIGMAYRMVRKTGCGWLRFYWWAQYGGLSECSPQVPISKALYRVAIALARDAVREDLTDTIARGIIDGTSVALQPQLIGQVICDPPPLSSSVAPS